MRGMAQKEKNFILNPMLPSKQCDSFLPLSLDASNSRINDYMADENSEQHLQIMSDCGTKLNKMLGRFLAANVTKEERKTLIKISNYHCKLLSPLLTKYGMSKETGKAKLLAEMNKGDIFDCAVFGDRSFAIDQGHINIIGFGRDVTGSMRYLSGTLNLINAYNNNEERLIPIHADGDGHCLVHAVSRALVGRELFWHPLRCSLKKHFEDYFAFYKAHFESFGFGEKELSDIIAECDPNFVPPDGELLGLRNIHIFGLANVLKRPIILLDSLDCMQNSGDYAGIFLPAFIEPDLCKAKDGIFNKPLCIAWSNPSHNHYIPLVGVKDKALPVLPAAVLPTIWAFPSSLAFKYIKFDDDGGITVGSNRSLGDSYIKQLIEAMDQLFLEKYGVHPSIVTHIHSCLYQDQDFDGSDYVGMIHKAKEMVEKEHLYICLRCDSLAERFVSRDWFKPGGIIYSIACRHSILEHDGIYRFPLYGFVCKYNAHIDELELDPSSSIFFSCNVCKMGHLRRLKADGSIAHKNGDLTNTPSTNSSGFKYFFDGVECDNVPKRLYLLLEWKNNVVCDTVFWFENESDETINSNVYKIASDIVQKHFPGEFGSERLFQSVVTQILNQIGSKDCTRTLKEKPFSDNMDVEKNKGNVPEVNKIIVPGAGVLHKEELGISNVEKQLLTNIQSNATCQQKRQQEGYLQKNNKLVAKELKLNNYVNPEKCNENEQTQHPESQKPGIIGIVKSDIHQNDVEKPKRCNEEQIQHSESEKPKIIRIVTSDGRQANYNISVEGTITYSHLQFWIEKQFNIIPERQRIKYGFPPQLLQPPPNNESKSLSLSHGDRIIVETITGSNVQSSLEKAEIPQPTQSSKNLKSWSPPRQAAWEKKLDDLSVEGDPWKMQTHILMLYSEVSNQTVWSYAKKRAHFFRPNGIFYEQAVKDYGKKDDHHFSLRVFPNKTFVYNKMADIIQLCIKPHGHFIIREGMDTDIIKALNPEREKFSCSLTSKSSVSHDLGASSSFNVAKADNLMPSLPNDTVKDTLIRKGPGYSVLNTVAPTSETFNVLKTCVKELVQNAHPKNNWAMLKKSTEAPDLITTVNSLTCNGVKTFIPNNSSKDAEDDSVMNSDLSDQMNCIAKLSNNANQTENSDMSDMICDVSQSFTNGISSHEEMDVDI